MIPRIDRIPTTGHVDFEPPSEIHRLRRRRYADIAEITCAVARRDVHATAQGNAEMGEIPADARPLLEHVPGCLFRIRMRVREGDMAVHEVRDGLNPRPTRR